MEDGSRTVVVALRDGDRPASPDDSSALSIRYHPGKVVPWPLWLAADLVC
jgi:hypothetical protein